MIYNQLVTGTAFAIPAMFFLQIMRLCLEKKGLYEKGTFHSNSPREVGASINLKFALKTCVRRVSFQGKTFPIIFEKKIKKS